MPTILVVAAKAVMRLNSVNLLRRSGFTPVEADSGESAVARYESTHPHGVLLDLSLAEQESLATLRHIKRIDAQARIAVIATQARKETVLDVVEAGASDFLIKPFQPARLLQAVQTLVSPPTERQHPRVPVDIPADIALGSPTAASHACTVEDLSVGGARCRLKETLPSGDPIAGTSAQLRFALPGGLSPVVAIGRVARVVDEGVLSVAFMQMTQRDHDMVEVFCRQTIEQQHIAQGKPADRRADPE